MKKTSLFLLFMLATVNTFAQAEPKFAKIDELLNHFYTNDVFMGSVCIREKGNVVFEKAYGYADVENNIAATTQTKYKIGSITKMFTAAVVFQLIEEKKLDMDAKLSQFYPEIKNADSITISMLLNHKSGIFNYTDHTDFGDYLFEPQSKAAMLKRLAGYEPAFGPDERAEYSNSNYLLLGYIIEDVTNKSYKANLNERIIKPLRLRDTYYYSQLNSKRNEAYSYMRMGDSWKKSEEWDDSVAFAAGALLSTPYDLTQFIDALFDGKIIKKESLEQMTKLDMGYGKGILIFPFGERRFFGHNGGIEAFSSVLGYYPKEKMSFSIIQNGKSYDLNEIVVGVLSIYYKMPYPFPNLKHADVAPEILQSYQGVYASEGMPLKITITSNDGKLTAQATGQSDFPLTPVSDTEFVFNPAGITILFKDKNSFILKQGGMEFTFTRE